MARRKGFMATMVQVQRDVERQRREQARQQASSVRARQAAQRAAERAARADAKERARLHAEARAEHAAALQAELDEQVEELSRLLADSLAVDDFVDPNRMKEPWQPAPFNPGPLGQATSAPDPDRYRPAPLGGLAKLVPGATAKQAAREQAAQHAFQVDVARWQQAEKQRVQQLQAAQVAYERWLAQERQRVAQQHAEIDAFVAALLAKQPDAVCQYFDLVLDGSVWPDGFPQSFVLAYDPASSLLGVDYTLPAMDIVPTVKTYKYVKTRDEITTTERPVTARRSLYTQVVTQAALRILHEVFESDRFGVAEVVALNCYVHTVHPATGQPVQPCILSVRTTREVFAGINLAQVDPPECLKALAAAVSANPAELAPVRPVVELKLIDPRFVDEQDVLSELDTRPNLMELSPLEFESLITNLFTKMGLESRQTQASRDGGVDCVAYDPRPIFGGKVVIQAKRYKNTVGVADVRDLYGTVQNEGASKGILVTTSGYGATAYKFAEGKPLELLSGANLLHLLEEHAGISARITMAADAAKGVIDLNALDDRRASQPPPAPAEPGSNPQHHPFPQPRSGRP
ncbi:MAG: restriction endonuclease [Acidimicrobiia bacterium]